jgi:hypothetical protein
MTTRRRKAGTTQPTTKQEEPSKVNTGKSVPSIRAVDVEKDPARDAYMLQIPISHHIMEARGRLDTATQNIEGVIGALRVLSDAKDFDEASQLVMAVERLFVKAIEGLDQHHDALGMIQNIAFKEEVSRAAMQGKAAR